MSPVGGGGHGPGRIWLDVPYAEKDQAKKLGARWDPAERRWYAGPAAAPALLTRRARARQLALRRSTPPPPANGSRPRIRTSPHTATRPGDRAPTPLEGTLDRSAPGTGPAGHTRIQGDEEAPPSAQQPLPELTRDWRRRRDAEENLDRIRRHGSAPDHPGAGTDTPGNRHRPSS